LNHASSTGGMMLIFNSGMGVQTASSWSLPYLSSYWIGGGG